MKLLYAYEFIPIIDQLMAKRYKMCLIVSMQQERAHRACSQELLILELVFESWMLSMFSIEKIVLAGWLIWQGFWWEGNEIKLWEQWSGHDNITFDVPSSKCWFLDMLLLYRCCWSNSHPSHQTSVDKHCWTSLSGLAALLYTILGVHTKKSRDKQIGKL